MKYESRFAIAILLIVATYAPAGLYRAGGAVWLAAAAPTGHFKVFKIPTANSQPRHVTAGPDGNVWFTESDINGGKIGRIDAAGTVTEFVVPTAGSQPDDIVAGPDGALWFTAVSGFPDFFIGRITTNGQMTGFAPACDPAGGCSIVPGGIASGPDGNIWFTEHIRNAVVRLTPAGVFTFFTIPTAAANPQGITRGPDNALWFAENGVNQIGRIDTLGNIVEFALTGRPDRITLGPDGNLWFTEPLPADSKIGSITVNGLVSEFQVTVQSQPSDIVAGPDGNLWFTEFNTEFLSQITPAGVVTDVIKARGGPFGIGRAPDGALWVALMSGNKLGRFSLR